MNPEPPGCQLGLALPNGKDYHPILFLLVRHGQRFRHVDNIYTDKAFGVSSRTSEM
jgi:hypothetical protein